MAINFQIIVILGMLGAVCGNNCSTGYWQCKNGKCIQEEWYCDGAHDCYDLSDEPLGCSHCDAGKWQCFNSYNCIPTGFLCDGYIDCDGGSDELDPVTGKCPTCPEDHFQCSNGRCIPDESKCDNINDCKDGSDEDLPCPSCRIGQFRCKTGECIDASRICDGMRDCLDASDERTENGTCPEYPPQSFICSDDEYRCKAASDSKVLPAACIPLELVCDKEGIWNCPLGDDEADCTK